MSTRLSRDSGDEIWGAVLTAFALLIAAQQPQHGYIPIYDVPVSKAVLRRPTPELQALRFMVGTWRCRIRSFATAKTPAHDYGTTTYTARFVSRNRLNGERPWLYVEDAGDRDLTYMTYDPLAKQWVYTEVEWPISYGVSVGRMSGNRWIFVGDGTVFGRNYRLRTTITKVSNDRFTLLNEERLPNGRWLRDDEYDYTRAPR